MLPPQRLAHGAAPASVAVRNPRWATGRSLGYARSAVDKTYINGDGSKPMKLPYFGEETTINKLF